MKEADVITMYMQTEYITLGECRSALDLLTKTVETKKNHIGHPLYECPFIQKNQDGMVAWHRIFFLKAVLLKYNKEDR